MPDPGWGSEDAAGSNQDAAFKENPVTVWVGGVGQELDPM